MNEDLENHSKDQLPHSAHKWNLSLTPRERERQSENPSIRKESITRVFLNGYALIAGRIWKGDILIADIEELEELDASAIYPRRLNKKRSLDISKKTENSYFLW